MKTQRKSRNDKDKKGKASSSQRRLRSSADSRKASAERSSQKNRTEQYED